MQKTVKERIVGAAYLSRMIVEADDPVERFVQFVRFGGILYGLAGILSVLGGTLISDTTDGFGVLMAVGVVCMLVALIALGAPDRLRPEFLLTAFFVGVGTTSFASLAAGRQVGSLGALIYIWLAAFGFCVLRRKVAIALIVSIAVGYAIVLNGHHYLPGDLIGIWLWVMITVVVTGAIVGWAFHYANDRANAERVIREELSRAHEELSTFSMRLREQVDEQLEQLERLGQLRRFLSPAVADALLSAESDHIFKPHRREISVVFVDLRGFTAFSASAEPEEIVELLRGYYDQLGQFVNRYGATVGTFSGDGVMLYLNDPVPCSDPAGTAVEMALEIRQALADAARAWKRDGFDLSFGIGIAFGYATLGTIGFADREDYTAVGTVVNLAARLCEVATAGQILIDPKTRAAVDWISAEELQPVAVKGFRDPIVPFNVVARARRLEAVPDAPISSATSETA